MKTLIAVAVIAIAGLFGHSAGADEGKALDTTAMGQSFRTQLEGVDYQFAIARAGQLEMTGEGGYASPTEAINELELGTLGGDETKCHLSDNGVEVVVILTNPPTTLPQPCGIVGEAMDAAA